MKETYPGSKRYNLSDYHLELLRTAWREIGVTRVARGAGTGVVTVDRVLNVGIKRDTIERLIAFLENGWAPNLDARATTPVHKLDGSST